MTNRERAERDLGEPYSLAMARIQAEEAFTRRKEAEDRARSLETGTIAHQDMRFTLKRDVLAFVSVVAAGLLAWGLWKVLPLLASGKWHGALS